VKSGSWWVAGVSVAGRSHVAKGLPCEDAHFTHDEGDTVVLVACDGKGSRAKYSALGAAAVARTVGRVLVAHSGEVFGGDLSPQTVLDSALSSLEPLAEQKQADIREFACTLVALVANESEVVTFHIGDGAAFMLDREVPLCISPPTCEGSATYFVTSKNPPLMNFRRATGQRATGFMVTTDGAEGLYNPRTNEVHPLATRLVNRADFGPGAGLLKECVERQIQPTSIDDITVVVARKAGVAGVYGCPACRGQNIGAFLSRHKQAFHVRCRTCKTEVMRVLLDDVPDAYQIFQRRLHEASFTHGMIRQRLSPRR